MLIKPVEVNGILFDENTGEEIYNGGTGIYSIVNIANLPNFKEYIGSTTVSFAQRWRSHKSELRRGKHPNKHLQRAWNKYGEENFRFYIIWRCSPEECLEREEYYVREYSIYPLYNIAPVRKGLIRGEHSKETRERIKKASTGRKMSKEARENMSKAQTGLRRSREAVEKTAAAHRGIPRSEETRKRISESRKKHEAMLTPEQKERRIEIARLGGIAVSKLKLKPSPETIEKLRKRNRNPEMIEKITKTKRERRKQEWEKTVALLREARFKLN